MNRRDFLQRATIVASGAVAADQLELLDRLGWVRRFFTSVAIEPEWKHLTDGHRNGAWMTQRQWNELLRDDYSAPVLLRKAPLNTEYFPRIDRVAAGRFGFVKRG